MILFTYKFEGEREHYCMHVRGAPLRDPADRRSTHIPAWPGLQYPGECFGRADLITVIHEGGGGRHSSRHAHATVRMNRRHVADIRHAALVQKYMQAVMLALTFKLLCE